MYDLEKRLARLADDRSWDGMLCRDTAQGIGDRIQRMLGDKPFAVVTANSYDENSTRYLAVDTRTSQWLTRPIDVDLDPDWFRVGLLTTNWSMSISSRCLTETEARAEGLYHGDYVHVTFENDRKLVVDHFAPAGYKLQWTFAVEDHTWFNEWREAV